MKIEKVSIEEIKPFKNNAKLHPPEQIEQIKKSIIEFGNNDPIAVDENNVIIEGHGRYQALKNLGYKEVEVIRLTHLTEQQKKAYILVHNKLTMDTGFDLDILNLELDNIIDFNMSDFGFEKLNFLDESQQETIEDKIPDTPEEPKAKLGDIYKLGNHRLMCGDSTKREDIEKLMNGNKADMVFTDPPYNMSFNGRSGNFEIIKNDNLNKEDFKKFIDRFINMLENINPKTYYICCNWFFYGILQLRLEPKTCIVWAKNNFGLGKGYRHQHEFILFKGFIKENIKNETDLWTINKDVKYMHPTQKPIEISSRAIQNSSEKDDIILDMFGGSGSTLIACEQLNRRCYMMELDPIYVDVIIERFEKFAGKKAVKINGSNISK